MEQTTVATVVGIAASVKGATIRASVGTVLGPVGTGVGGFVGGTVGIYCRFKGCKTVLKVLQEVYSYRDRIY